MKIRKIRYQDHSLFGNTEFDFTDNEGNVIDTIILAGENGVGKSRLMNDIHELSRYELPNKKSNKIVSFEIELSEKQVQQLSHEARLRNFVVNYGAIFHITLDSNFPNDWKAIEVENVLISGKRFKVPSHELYNNKIMFQSIFSNSEVNFDSAPITTVQTSDIDSDRLSISSNTELATDVAQLLVDIQILDALDLSNWVINNSGSVPPDEIKNVKMKRFTNAFDYMFPSKKYERIENTPQGKEIIFSEGSNEMTLNQLSSGEKQIVFRGGFLLRNKESSKGALILIDEPELSLHPSWQIKSLDFFKKLFTDSEGSQTSQIIISTHSPFIIHNPNRNNDKVVVLKKNETGKTYIAKNPQFVNWTNEQAVKEAFSIEFDSFSNSTTVFLEGETDEKYFNTAKRIFGKSELPFKFQWIGRINDKNSVENTGDSALNNAISFFKANEDLVKSKVVFLFDNDTKKPDSNHSNIYIRRMSEGVHYTFKKGVESLLNTDSVSEMEDFYHERSKVDDYGAKSIISSLDKMKLCNFICEELTLELQKQVLSNINKEIEALLDVVQTSSCLDSKNSATP